MFEGKKKWLWIAGAVIFLVGAWYWWKNMRKAVNPDAQKQLETAATNAQGQGGGGAGGGA